MESSYDGLTIWYDTEDAPIRNGTLTIGARPAHPANVVTVLYRRGGKLLPSVSARPLSFPGLGKEQYFVAPLPPLSESGVDILPILSCAGRQAPPPEPASAETRPWFRYQPPADAAPPVDLPRPEAPGTRVPRFTSNLDFLGQVSVTLTQPPETIGVVARGLQKNFYIAKGCCVGPKLNASIRGQGADWMLIQRDGVAVPNVRTTWETTDGALLYGEYSGVFDLGEDGYENALRDRYPVFPTVQLAPRFVTEHRSYGWINRVQCLGIGQVDMKNLQVEYDLYAVRGGTKVSETACRDGRRG